MNNKLIVRLIGTIIIVILFFQLIKRDNDLIILNEKKNLIERANTPYAKLLDQLPVYRDSVYKIYIANIEGDSKIVFFKKNSISDKQRKSKFFLHIYPKDKNLLGENKLGNLAYDFNNNVMSFSFNEITYYVSSANLPNIKINKINTGQYGFNGNNDVNWSIKLLIEATSIEKILRINKEKIFQFQ